MSDNHVAFIQTAERRALKGYISALKICRDDVAHADSRTINAITGWLADAEAKLKEWDDRLGKQEDGSDYAGSSAGTLPSDTDDESDTTDGDAAAGVGPGESGKVAQAA